MSVLTGTITGKTYTPFDAKDAIDAGGQGTIVPVKNMPDKVIKFYTVLPEDSGALFQKLTLLAFLGEQLPTKTVVRIIEPLIDQSGQLVGFVMPKLVGKNLEDYMRHLSLIERVRAALGVVASTDYFTKMTLPSITITDLKPGNFIRLDSTGELVKVDIDSVQIENYRDPLNVEKVIAINHGSAGTEGYRSPELINLPHKRCDAADVLFALAVTIYEIIYDVHPAMGLGASVGNLDEAVKVAAFPRYFDLDNGLKLIPCSYAVPTEVDQLLSRALIYAPPHERPTCQNWHTALSAWLTELNAGQGEQQITVFAKRPRTLREKVIYAAKVTLVVLVVLIAAWRWIDLQLGQITVFEKGVLE